MTGRTCSNQAGAVFADVLPSMYVIKPPGRNEIGLLFWPGPPAHPFCHPHCPGPPAHPSCHPHCPLLSGWRSPGCRPTGLIQVTLMYPGDLPRWGPWLFLCPASSGHLWIHHQGLGEPRSPHLPGHGVPSITALLIISLG